MLLHLRLQEPAESWEAGWQGISCLDLVQVSTELPLSLPVLPFFILHIPHIVLIYMLLNKYRVILAFLILLELISLEQVKN